MSKNFIVIGDGSIIRKSIVDLVTVAADDAGELYTLIIYHHKGMLKFVYDDSTDADRELQKLRIELLSSEE